MKRDNSQKLFAEAEKYMPGGVSSPVRAFKAVGGSPLFIKKGQGSRIYDEDGNAFIDYCCSWGPLILGHSQPQIVAAVKKAAAEGTSFGAPTRLETELAEAIVGAVPSIEMVRLVSSGTEAAMSAIRLARAYTGRDNIVKFAGGYHGHSDGLLVRAGSGLATLGISDCPGVPQSYAEHTLVAPYNDLDAVEQMFTRHPDSIAAVIIEPVAANMGVVEPVSGFLEGLRRLTKGNGALLIFDEVITGFRLSYGGAQGVNGVLPDLTILGKIIGGGLPVGAYGGTADIMKMVAPCGPVYQAGTLSGNPLAVTAGIEMLKLLRQPGLYQQLENKASRLADGIEEAAARHKVTIQLARAGSLITAFFTGEPVTDYETAQQADTGKYARFFGGLLEEGIYWPPSQFEAAFVSAAHSDEDIEATIRAMDRAFSAL
jgi:glutamate-1-semialdehyde 2,1-aminomutase